jgi:hypothetical protein
MTTGAMDALHADREAILKIGAGLTDAEWAAPSGCPGWSAKDVLAPRALLGLVIDPASLPDATGLETERAQEMYVESGGPGLPPGCWPTTSGPACPRSRPWKVW